jgi:hypothetical protein
MRGAPQVVSFKHRIGSALRAKAPLLFILGIVLLCILVAVISTSSPSGAVRSIVLVECQVEEKPLLFILLPPAKSKTNVPYSQLSTLKPQAASHYPQRNRVRSQRPDLHLRARYSWRQEHHRHPDQRPETACHAYPVRFAHRPGRAQDRASTGLIAHAPVCAWFLRKGLADR